MKLPILVLLLLSLLMFGVPAVIIGTRRLVEQRRVQKEELRRATAQAEAEARAAADLNTQRWRVHPQRMVATALLVFRAHVRAPVEGELAISQHNLTARTAELKEARDRIPTVLRNSPTLRVVVLGCLVALPVLLVVESLLDYRIFEAMFPGDGWPLFMALVYVLALAVFTLILTVLCGMHGRLNLSSYWRMVLIIAAAVALVGTMGFLVYIAPNRSAPTTNHAVTEATYRLQMVQNSQSLTDSELQGNALGKAKADLEDAKRSRDHAALVDRVSAGVVAATEPALVEGSVFGVLLALLWVRQYRLRQAELAVQAAKNNLHRVDLRFSGEVGPLLVTADHGPEEIRGGIALANQAWGTGSAPALSASNALSAEDELGAGRRPASPASDGTASPGLGSSAGSPGGGIASKPIVIGPATSPPSWQDEDEVA